MSSSTTTPETTDSAFVCASGSWMHSACAGESFYKEYEGKRYCVFHYPGKEKSADFDVALKRKRNNEDADFRGVWFPSWVSFTNHRFSIKADFEWATFSEDAYFLETKFDKGASFQKAAFCAKALFGAATFGESAQPSILGWANFRDTVFNAEAVFHHTHFQITTFPNAIFKAKADFGDATFDGKANFRATTFSAEADFRLAAFSNETDFSSAIFNDYVKFSGEGRRHLFGSTSSLNLQFARIAKPEHVSFHTLTLRPHWFVNVDARKFEFTNVGWDWRDINEEIESLKHKGVSAPHRLLEIACRNLAVNAEENHRYRPASRFRFMAMEARRVQWAERLRGNFFKAQWKASRKILTLVNRSRKRDGKVRRGMLIRLRRFARTYQKSFDLLHCLYWAASGYGEKITRAFVLLIAIWIFFAGLYMLTGHIRVHRASDMLGAVNYSLSVMALQKPEPKSVAGLTPLLITFETILGPVQAALLALAIRRKFMR
jgi:uncharacterized protein YjbI with pentapeptide repeats